MKVDERLVQSLLRLREPGFEPLLAYLRDKRVEELDNILRSSEMPVIYRQQGRVQQLSELLALIADAERLRDKFRN